MAHPSQGRRYKDGAPEKVGAFAGAGMIGALLSALVLLPLACLVGIAQATDWQWTDALASVLRAIGVLV